MNRCELEIDRKDNKFKDIEGIEKDWKMQLMEIMMLLMRNSDVEIVRIE